MSSSTTSSYKRLTVLHVNDIQGHFTPSEATWIDSEDPPKVGGIASFSTYLKQERKQAYHDNRALLVLDAGDWFTGTPESGLTDGKAMIKALNQVQIDFTTIGNHDFDYGAETLAERIESLDHTVLAGNTRYPADTAPFSGTRDTAIVQRAGVDIGLFGLITDEMDELTTDKLTRQTTFLNHLERSRALVRSLNSNGAEFIIGLTHVGFGNDRELARKVDGIDLIVGGHSHKRVQTPKVVDGTVIAQAGDNLTNVGRIDLDLDSSSGELLRHRGGLVGLYHDRYPPDTTVQQAVQPFIDRAEQKLGEVVGRTTGRLTRNSEISSPLGNLITDAMRVKTNADVAFQNAFGIRAEIPRGPVERRKLYEVLPFGNELVTMSLSGTQIEQLIEQSATFEKGLLQISGLRVTLAREAEKGERVQSVRIDDEPLKPDQQYTIVTNTFLAGGGDRFTTFEQGSDPRTLSGVTIREAMTDWFRSNSPVEPATEQRYRFN